MFDVDAEAARAAAQQEADKEARKDYYTDSGYLPTFKIEEGQTRLVRLILPSYVDPANTAAYNAMGITYCFASALAVSWGQGKGNFNKYVDPAPFGMPNPYNQYATWVEQQGTAKDKERLAEIKCSRSHYSFLVDMTDHNAFNLGLQLYELPWTVVQAIIAIIMQKDPITNQRVYPLPWDTQNGFGFLIRKYKTDGNMTKYEVKPHMGNSNGVVTVQCMQLPNAVELLKQADENDIGGFIYLETEETIREMLSGVKVYSNVKRTRREIRDKAMGRDPVTRFKSFTNKDNKAQDSVPVGTGAAFQRPPVTPPAAPPQGLPLPVLAPPPTAFPTAPATFPVAAPSAPIAPPAAFQIPVPPTAFPVAPMPVSPPGSVATAAATAVADDLPWLKKG